MSELISLMIRLDWKGLFLKPTDNGLLQFFRYAFVGGIASVVDWGVLWGVEKMGVYYLLAAVVSFFAGLLTNFLLSKKLVFHGETARVNSFVEFLAYGAIGAVGLLLTLLMLHTGRIAVPVTAHFFYNISALAWPGVPGWGSILGGAALLEMIAYVIIRQPKMAHPPMKWADGLIAAAAVAVLITLYFI